MFGPRKTLIRIVLWWSLFTALTGLAGLKIGGVILVGFGALVVIRFLFGVGEAGAYPNITRALHNWFPATERGFTQGLVWMSGRLVGGLTPLIWTLLVVWGPLSWGGAFWTFGSLGLVWCVFFVWRFRNRPEEKPERQRRRARTDPSRRRRLDRTGACRGPLGPAAPQPFPVGAVHHVLPHVLWVVF